MILSLTRCHNGYLVKTEAGYQLQVWPRRLFRLVEVPERDVRAFGRFWCYMSFEAAVLAGLAWAVSADSEPVGWVRRGGARLDRIAPSPLRTGATSSTVR